MNKEKTQNHDVSTKFPFVHEKKRLRVVEMLTSDRIAKTTSKTANTKGRSDSLTSARTVITNWTCASGLDTLCSPELLNGKRDKLVEMVYLKP